MPTLKRPVLIPSKRPLVVFSAAFSVVAILVTALIERGLWTGLRTAVLVALVYLAAGGLSLVPLNRALLLGLAAGIIWCGGYVTLFYHPALAYEGRTAVMEFRADSYAKGYEEYGMVTGTILSIDGEEVSFKAKVYLTDGSPDYSPGNILCFTGKLSRANAGIRKNNLQNGIFLQISQTGSLTVSHHRPTPLNHAAIFSHAIQERILQLLEGEEGVFLAALLTGDRSDFSDELYRALTISGSSHITAVSGMHISMLVTLMVAALGRKKGLYAVLPVMLCFAAVAGLSPSVLRAVIMCGFTVAAFALRQEGDTLTALFAALLILTAFNPFGSLSAGLLLSFASTLGIVLFTPMMTAFFNKYRPKKLARVYRHVTSSLAMSIAAMVLTMPLCILLFDAVSLVSALTTLLVMWAVSLSMGLGLAVLLISVYIWPLAALLAKYVVYWPLAYCIWVIYKIGSLPWAVLHGGNLYLVVAVITLAGVTLAAGRGKLKAAASVGLAMLTFCSCFALTAWERSRYWEIALFGDEGGPVLLLRSRGNAMAIGVGGGLLARTTDDVLLEWGIAGVDTLLVTNANPRTVTGLPSMAAQVKAGRILSPGVTMLPPNDDKTAHLWYDEEGCFPLGIFTVTVLAMGEGYAAYVAGGDISILNLAGVSPLDALGAVDCRAALLVVDKAYGTAPYTLERLCAIVQPQLIYYCDDGFEYSAMEFVGEIPVITASQRGRLTLLSRK